MLLSIYRICISIISIKIIGKYGRRLMMLTGIALIGLCLFTMFIMFTFQNKIPTIAPWVILGAILFFVFNFTTSVGPVMWIYCSEIVQPRTFSAAITVHWIATALVAVAFPLAKSACGNPDCPYIFLFLFLCMVINFIVEYIFMIETKGKTEIEIREEFNMMKIC